MKLIVDNFFLDTEKCHDDIHMISYAGCPIGQPCFGMKIIDGGEEVVEPCVYLDPVNETCTNTSADKDENHEN